MLADSVDDEPLTRPADAAAIREFAQTSRRARIGNAAAVGCVTAIVLVVGALFAGAFAMGPLSGGSRWWWVPCGIVVLLTLLLAGFVVRRQLRSARTGPESQWRLAAFFAANGITPVDDIPDAAYRGVIFSLGQIRPRLANVTRWFDGAVEVGEYHYVVQGYRGIQSPAQWGYARILLDAPAPDLLLDAASNNALGKAGALSNFPDVRTPTTLRSADGARFTLWAWPRHVPAATELAAQDLVDLLARYSVDLEIVDGVAYLYWSSPLQFADAERWRWLFTVAQALRSRRTPPQV